MSGFGIFALCVGIGELCAYVYLVGSDLLRKDPADLNPVQEDEDVDISDEAGKFQPVVIERENKPKRKKEAKTAQSTAQTHDTSNGNASPQEETKPPQGSTEFTDSDEEPSNRRPVSVASDLPPQTQTNRTVINELVGKLRAGESLDDYEETDDNPPQESQEDSDEKKEKDDAAKDKDTHDTHKREDTDDRATIDMRVHIDEEATHVRFSEVMTAEQLSEAAEKAAEDPGEMALREIENGWRLLRIQKEKEDEEAMKSSGLLTGDTPPNVTFGKTKTQTQT